MPTAPLLPPEAMQQQTQAAQGMNPTNFLIAAASASKGNSFSMPSGPHTDPLASTKSKKPFGKKVQMVK
jgi:hypothetical protein